MVSQRPFRAIVVGSGPAGLSLAHCLGAANIDYVVLERRPQVVEPTGAGLGIWAPCCRLLDQLGLYEKVKELCIPVGPQYDLDEAGNVISVTPFIGLLDKGFGYMYLMLGRQQFVELLYNELREKERIQTNKRVVSIDQGDDYAKVIMSDGSSETGDIVIGTDGVYSTVRAMMGSLQKQKSLEKSGQAQKGTKPNEHYSYEATFRCLYGTSTMQPGFTPGDMILTHKPGASYQALQQKDKIYWILYEKLDKSTKEFKRYNEEETRAFGEKYFDFPCSPGQKFQTIWENRVGCHTAVLEEGLYPNWHQGRIVLVGDTVHKMTPSLALGFNSAFESAAALTNQLHKVLNSGPQDKPTTAELEQALEDFQEKRFKRAKESQTVSAWHTRYATWDTLFHKLSSYIMPRILPLNALAKQSIDHAKGGERLEFLEVPEIPGRTILFDDEVVDEKVKPTGIGRALTTVAILAVVAGVWYTSQARRSHELID